MSIHRKVRKAPEGKAGFEIQGLIGTYDEATAKRLQYMKTDGSDELDLPKSGKLAEVSEPESEEDESEEDESEENEPSETPPPGIANPSGRP